jgi:hypothetical protein
MLVLDRGVPAGDEPILGEIGIFLYFQSSRVQGRSMVADP